MYESTIHRITSICSVLNKFFFRFSHIFYATPSPEKLAFPFCQYNLKNVVPIYRGAKVVALIFQVNFTFGIESTTWLR